MDDLPQSLPATDLLLEHSEFLAALSARLVSSGADAEDLLQETWLSALRHPPADAGAVRAWLAKVVRNHARQQHRSRRRRAAREQWVARDEGLPSTDDIVARENARRAVVDSLSELAEPYRSTLLLRFYEDLPPRDVAARLGVPVETVRTRLKRGLALLRENLDRRNGGDRSAWTSALLPLALGELPLPSASTSASLTPLTLPFGLLTLLVAALLWGTRDWRSDEVAPAAPAPQVAQTQAAGDVSGAATLRSAGERGQVRRAYAVRLVFDDDDGPAAGLEASLVRQNDSEPPQAWISDGEGSAPAELLLAPGDSIRVLPSRVSRALELTLDELSLQGEFVELRIARASSARGRVVDGASRPVAGALVWAAAPTAALLENGAPSEPLTSAISDASGEFELLELPFSFYVHAQDGERTLLRGAHVQSREHRAHPDLELRLEQGWLASGRVVDAGGAPLAGVRIRTSTHDLRGGGRAASESVLSWRNLLRSSWTTDADGRFEIRGLAPIAHNLGFELEGFRTFGLRVTGPDWNETVVLERDTELVFELRDARGAALAGDVSVLSESGRSTPHAALDGQVSMFIDSSERSAFVRSRAIGFATQWFVLDLNGDARTTRVLQFEAERRLTVRVEDERGEPVPDASVAALGEVGRALGSRIAPELAAALLEISRAQVGVDARVSLGGLPHEGVTVEVSAPGFATARLHDVRGQAELRVVLERATLELPRLELSARALGTGAPVAGCIVTARSDSVGGVLSLVSRFDGSAELPLPQQGLWSLYAQAPGYAPLIRRWREGDEPKVEFEFAAERSVSVLARDLRGAPVHPARLVVSDERGAPLPSAISATYWANYIEMPEQGEVVVRGLPAARVRLTLRSAHLEGAESMLVDLREETDARVVLEIPADLSSPRARVEFEIPAGFASTPVQPRSEGAAEPRSRGRRAAAPRLLVWDASGVLCGRYRFELDETGEPRFLQPWTMMILRFDSDGVLEAAGQQRLEGDALFTDFGPVVAPQSRRVSVLAPAAGGRAALEIDGAEVMSAHFAPPYDAPQRFAPVAR